MTVLLCACGETPVTSGVADTTTNPSITTASAPVTTTETPVTTVGAAQLLAENKYANAGLELVLSTCEKYYNLRSHTLNSSLTDTTPVTIWGLASYIEMLAEAYRLYPDNATVKTYYEDVLNRCLPFYRVTNATITPPSGEVYTGITYYNAGRNSQGDFYYDDNAWICIQLLNAYRLLGKETYLQQAEAILEFMWTGWDDKAGGGIYWDKTFQGKGICCNGPVAVSYLEGYRLTKNETYLERAKRIYDWAGEYLRDEKGLYSEGVTSLTAANPGMSPWRAAYDQGTMMTSAALLYEITGEERYYRDLSGTAGACINLMFKSSGGKIQMAGNPIFKSWCIGWLLRGEMMANNSGCENVVKMFMRRMKSVLDDTLETKDENGQYDPYFCSGEWWPPADNPDIDYFDHEVIQPTGVATVLLLTACYDVYQVGQN